MRPNQDDPDFSFLHEPSSGKDSAIIESEAQEAEPVAPEPDLEEQTEEPASPVVSSSEVPAEKTAEKPEQATSESQPAWMTSSAETEEPGDSSTRFAAALQGGHSGGSGNLFAFDEKTEQIVPENPALTVGEETVVDENLSPASAAEESMKEPAEAEEIAEEVPQEEEEGTSSAQIVSSEFDEEEIEDSGEGEADAEESDNTETVDYQESDQVSDVGAFDDQDPAAESSAAAKEPEPPFNFADAFSSNSAAATPPPVVPAAAEVPVAAAVASVAAKKKKSAPAAPKRANTSAEQGEKDSNLKFLLLVSYASAVTLVCAYLLFQSFTGKPHELESLPDLKPPMKEDEIAYKLVPEKAAMPAGHTLHLGQSRRYGNLMVTPLRVEKEPLQFTHYTGDAARKREATAPVFKLWLKFENVSKDQKFAPLDRQLMLTRIVDEKNPEFVRSNQYLCSASDKGKLAETRLLYDLGMHSDWNFAGMPELPVIGPGESIELYLPSTDEALPSEDEPLLWRVQFRKGYHPKSYRGVTTVIEVKIDADEIQSA